MPSPPKKYTDVKPIGAEAQADREAPKCGSNSKTTAGRSQRKIQ
jgi:hypothetical protein